MSYILNNVIRLSLGLNQSKTNRCKSINPDEEIVLVRESERDVVVNIIKNGDLYYKLVSIQNAVSCNFHKITNTKA